MNGQEFPTSLARNSPKHEFPSGHDFNPYNQYPQQSGYPPGIPSGTPPPPPQHQDLTIDGIPNLPQGGGGPGNGGGGGGGPFPHRRSRASRTFKNPPQPHMCIREKTIDGKEVFINVLSWTRIANPDNPDAPIPLYGGMKVGKIPPGSPRAPPLVYAVMASPEVLKKAGRKCPDTPERMNLVDLMCEFVEAMNPTLHLSRKPEILKDRDLSGELKDVWSAVQACRDKGRVDSVGPPENLVVYTEFGPETAPSYEQSQHHQQQHQQQQYHHQQHFPHHQHQQQQHHYGGDPFHQQQQQQPQNHHQQSAITNNSSSNSNNVDANSSDSPDVPDCATVSDQHLDELCQEADSLKIAPSKSNGLTLPTTTTTSPSGSAEATPATSPESNPVPAASTAPQQQGNSSSSSLSTTHSPTSPTSTTTTPVSPTTTPSPATPQKESKNTSHFFPMFRSSKSSEKSAAAAAASEKDANGGSPADPAAVANSAATGTTQPDTPVKTSSKKSGLNFFRRNKTDSKKAATTTEAPATPTKQKDNSSAGEKLIDKLDESLQHLQHHHHHHGGSNGTGEIIENSSATIVAK